jgi:magnesium transporter
MINLYPSSAPAGSSAAWIDLLQPTDLEIADVERITSLHPPTRAALSEIESSSRLRIEGENLFLSTPLLAQSDGEGMALTPVGFVLTPRLLLTVRFAPLAAFEAVGKRSAAEAQLTGEEVFLRLLETIVDQSADRLEEAATELESISQTIFRARPRGFRRVARTDQTQHSALRRVGEMGERVSKLRDSLLGLARVAGFVTESASHRLATGSSGRLNAVRADLTSLSDYQGHLLGKVQFLLDATLGFINIEQNDIVKALTIASVVGIPPVLIAGIYGMNFKFIPEYGWTFGYPYALILMLVSGLLPLLWFRWRGWM